VCVSIARNSPLAVKSSMCFECLKPCFSWPEWRRFSRCAQRVSGSFKESSWKSHSDTTPHAHTWYQHLCFSSSASFLWSSFATSSLVGCLPPSCFPVLPREREALPRDTVSSLFTGPRMPSNVQPENLVIFAISLVTHVLKICLPMMPLHILRRSHRR